MTSRPHHMRMRPLRPRRAPRCRACGRRGHIASNRLCPRNARAFPPKPIPPPPDAGLPIEGGLDLTAAELAELRVDPRALEIARAAQQRRRA